MIDILLTALVPLAMVLIMLQKPVAAVHSKFFGRSYTDTLKGLAALVVIMVHFSSAGTNKLQDVIGSFAFVAVTFFFLVSAYGMKMASETKPDYMKNFWRNRLVSLVTPMLIINIFSFGLYVLFDGEMHFDMLYKFNGYVIVLLAFCLWFWLVEIVVRKLKFSRLTSDLLLVGGVVGASLYLYFTMYKDVSARAWWCFEIIGLVWGLLLLRNFSRVEKLVNDNRKLVKFGLIALALVVGVLYIKNKEVYFWGAYMLKITLGFVILATLFIWSTKMRSGGRVALFLGSISYEIYLLHGIVIEWLQERAQLSSGLFILSVIAITVALATLVHYIGNPIVGKLRKGGHAAKPALGKISSSSVS